MDILPWRREGTSGCLNGGTSNLPPTGQVARFKLGYITESAKELEAATGGAQIIRWQNR